MAQSALTKKFRFEQRGREAVRKDGGKRSEETIGFTIIGDLHPWIGRMQKESTGSKD